MYTMDVETLGAIQQDRYNEFHRQAELLRLLRQPRATDAPAPATLTWRWSMLIAAFQQMVGTTLQTHVRALPPR